MASGLLTAGCGYITPQQTSHQYSASDGIRADLGPLQLRNMLIVSTGEDQPGRLIGAVYNSSSKDVKLTVNGAKGSQTEVPVKANSYTLLNDTTDAAILSTTGGKAGSLVELKVSENGTNVTNTVQGSRPGRHADGVQGVPAVREPVGHAFVVRRLHRKRVFRRLQRKRHVRRHSGRHGNRHRHQPLAQRGRQSGRE